MSEREPSAAAVTADQIVSFVDRVVAAFKPRRVVLFGSYARGTPTADSDVDLLITDRRWLSSPLTAAGRIRVAVGVPFPMD
jgi:predicted nucleotidyltransferase